MLWSIRKSTLSDKVNDYKQDTKKPYTKKTNIPIPKSDSDEQLAEGIWRLCYGKDKENL